MESSNMQVARKPKQLPLGHECAAQNSEGHQLLSVPLKLGFSFALTTFWREREFIRIKGHKDCRF